MSLKAFHILVIFLSTLLCVALGVWAVDDFGRSGSLGMLVFGVGSFIASVALAWYGLWFLRKHKDIGYL